MRKDYVGFVLILAALALLIEVQVIEYAYARIGISSRYLLLTLLATVFGSYVNIPVWRTSGHAKPRTGTMIAVNLGGAVIPLCLSVRIILTGYQFADIAIATGSVAAVTYLLARPVAQTGIVVPLFIPPAAAAIAALSLSREGAPAVAYVAGTMGTLIGADLMNLGRIRHLGAPIVSIGGAGTFDGIFLTGILAALLA